MLIQMWKVRLGSDVSGLESLSAVIVRRVKSPVRWRQHFSCCINELLFLVEETLRNWVSSYVVDSSFTLLYSFFICLCSLVIILLVHFVVQYS